MVRKTRSAGMWTGYSSHRVVRVGLTKKVIVEQRFGGGEEEPFKCHHAVGPAWESTL